MDDLAKEKDIILKYKKVFASSEGLDILFDLCTKCCFFEGTMQYHKGTVDPYASVFNDGQRDLFLHVLKMLNCDISMLNALYANNKKELLDEWGRDLELK